ncbi:lipopolysaccharide biosynthesis protein [Microbacterium paludicola]|uniref:lipopolysaccharide biosynthesis protein n=1 Tax=Microbacterium paludicola TaxID=300019 RepID=UPI0031D400B8
MALVRRLASFSAIPAISALIPFLVLPFLARSAGADAWVAIAVGQSVGGFLALVVSLGLNVVGPTLVATTPEAERPALFADGTRARLLAAVPAAAVGAIVAALLSPASEALSGALMAVAITFGGLSSGWYLIGLGRPLPLITYELVPRAIATAAGAAVVITGGPAAWYPALLLVAVLGGVGAYASRVVSPRLLLTNGWRASATLARRHLAAAATETVSGAYTTLAVSLVTGAASTAQAAAYVSGDKLFRMGQTIVGAQGNALQGWVVEDDRAHLVARARTAVLLHGALGLAGFAAFALLGPWLTAVLFGEKVAIDRITAVLFGVAILCVSLTTALGRHVLVAYGRSRDLFVSVISGAVVGVPATLILAGLLGAPGGAIGLASAEAVVLAVQLGYVIRLRGRERVRVREEA